ncbi:MAG: hypothetical protein M3Q22_16155 [Actinomycetota bacterium]|nr:hypothetical protein [Actinomycetota bacterium]
MVSSLCTRQLTSSVVALACTAAVVVFGELSTGALLAVGGTGVLAAAVGLARHAGEAAAPVGRRVCRGSHRWQRAWRGRWSPSSTTTSRP